MMKLYALMAGGLVAAAGLAAPAAAQDRTCAHPSVTHVGDDEIRICAGKAAMPQAGEVIALRRLEPVPGPSRPPHFHWRTVAKVRVVAIDGPHIVARAERGAPRLDDRADLGQGW